MKEINLNKIAQYYMEQDDRLYDPNVIEYMAKIFFEADGIPCSIIKDGVEYYGICNFDKEKQEVEIEREFDDSIHVTMPFDIVLD